MLSLKYAPVFGRSMHMSRMLWNTVESLPWTFLHSSTSRAVLEIREKPKARAHAIYFSEYYFFFSRKQPFTSGFLEAKPHWARGPVSRVNPSHVPIETHISESSAIKMLFVRVVPEFCSRIAFLESCNLEWKKYPKSLNLTLFHRLEDWDREWWNDLHLATQSVREKKPRSWLYWVYVFSFLFHREVTENYLRGTLRLLPPFSLQMQQPYNQHMNFPSPPFILPTAPYIKCCLIFSEITLQSDQLSV